MKKMFRFFLNLFVFLLIDLIYLPSYIWMFVMRHYVRARYHDLLMRNVDAFSKETGIPVNKLNRIYIDMVDEMAGVKRFDAISKHFWRILILCILIKLSLKSML